MNEFNETLPWILLAIAAIPIVLVVCGLAIGIILWFTIKFTLIALFLIAAALAFFIVTLIVVAISEALGVLPPGTTLEVWNAVLSGDWVNKV